MQTVLEVLFWISASAVLYAYVGYPILIGLAARFFGRHAVPTPLAPAELPRVSLIIAAYNEESVIADRIKNALALDYPAEKLEVVIASDASSDRTSEIVRSFAAPQVRLLEFDIREGKAAVLNKAVPQSTGDLLVFSDANTEMDLQALRRLADRFADPAVGVACGKLIIIDPRSGRNVDGLYWRYETYLKKCEGALGALLGANGGIYAMRRSLFVPLPPGIIVDDLVLPLQARIRSQCRLIFAPSAVAHEEAPANIGDEFRRRVRIGTGNFQSLETLWPLLSPRQGWTAFCFLSHKLLRWSCPLFLVVAMTASLLLSSSPLYQAAALLQMVFYAVAAVGTLLSGRDLASRIIRLHTMFCAMNVALAAGCVRHLIGRSQGVWTRTQR